MKIIFFGTPEYVLPILSYLHKTFNHGRERNLVAVVTQKPQLVGRSQQLEYSAVDKFAHSHKIPIYFLDANEDLPVADLGICAAFGRILPDTILSHFPLGILNIHPSLLPSWRGTAPTQAAILSGEPTTGLTVIKTDNQMDHGPIVSSFKSEILETDTNETLRSRLFEESVPFLESLIPAYVQNKINLKEQNQENATFTKLLKKEDGFLDISFFKDAVAGQKSTDEVEIRFMNKKFVPDAFFVDRFVRALTPWPGAYTKVRIKEKEMRLKIIKTHVELEKLIIDQVQLEGKNEVNFKQFCEGYPEAGF